MVFSRDASDSVPNDEELSQMVGLDDLVADGVHDQGAATRLELPLPGGVWQIPGPLKYVSGEASKGGCSTAGYV